MNINGVRFAVRDRGPAEGLPVVFLHGFPMDGSMWHPQVEAIVGNRRTIAWDLRGHGKSVGGGDLIAFEWFVDDLLGLLDAKGITRPVLVGLSMGGYVALRFAEREPDRVRALVLAGTKSTADGNEARVKRASAARNALEAGAAAFADGFLASALAPGADPRLLRSCRGTIAAMDPRSIAATLLAMAQRTDTTESLSKIQVPALVIVGEKDSLTPPSDARALAKGIPGARLVEIPGAGHFSNLEAPGAFNAALVSFLDAL
jgi:3-oxoadipate enol-lactonase